MIHNAFQRGAALITVLIFILVLAMIGISAMQGTAMEERMAANEWEYSRAFQAAESGLRDGRDWMLLQATLIDATDSGTNGVWTANTTINAIADSTFDWDDDGLIYGSGTTAGSSAFSGLYKPPRYVVEESGFVPDSLDPDAAARGEGRYYYNISSIGYGGTDSARVVLDAVIEKRYQ